MYDVKYLSMSSGLARRLIAMSQYNNLDFSPEISDLAMEDLLSDSDLEGSGLSLDPKSLETLQFVMDWKGRAMILEEGNSRSREIALASMWIRGGRTLILCQPKDYGAWATMIRKHWPNSHISVFGNRRYLDSGIKFPPNVIFEDTPDSSAQFFITSYGGMVWNDFFNHVSVDQTIVEELDNDASLNYRWADAVNSMFKEIPSPLFIQNIHHLPNDSGRDIFTSLSSPKSRALNFLANRVFTHMRAGLGQQEWSNHAAKENENYLISRGYIGLDQLTLMSLLGVSSHLLESSHFNSPLVWKEDAISRLQGKKALTSGLGKFLSREADLEELSGNTISNIVSSSLDGDRGSQALLRTLMTTQWATLKAQHIRTIHQSISSRLGRNLILVENQDLLRSLKLHFSPFDLVLADSQDMEVDVARFLPRSSFDVSPEVFNRMMQTKKSTQPLSNLFVSLDDLINHPKLLKVANFLILSEWPLEREYYQGVMEAAISQGTKVVSSVLSNTFEEEIYKQIQ